MNNEQTRRCFVTGGSGFIGRKLIDVLVRQGYAVRVLTRHKNRGFPVGVRVVLGDLASVGCHLSESLEGCTVIFHCAGEVRDVAAMRSLHIDGTKFLIQAVLKEAERRKQSIHWVQLSSVGAYGPIQGMAHAERIVTEDTPVHPVGEYEITKTISDELVLDAGKNGLLSCSIVRPSNVIGANMSNQSLYSLGRMVEKGLFFYIGPPGAIATYIHVDDVVEVLIRCSVDPRAKGKTFNISNDCLLEEMIEGMAKSLGVTCPKLRVPVSLARVIARAASKIVPIPLTQGRINALVARTRYPYSKLERELNFSPSISISHAIGEVVLAKQGL